MNPNREIQVKIAIPPEQQGPLDAALAALKIGPEEFAAAAVMFALRRAEEGVFDGSVDAGDALEFHAGFARILRDRIGRMVQVAEKALVDQQAVVATFRSRLLKASGTAETKGA
ncbi:MAG TPA: hypothetical protein VGD81_15495 [Opitutaceae bacterium]